MNRRHQQFGEELATIAAHYGLTGECVAAMICSYAEVTYEYDAESTRSEVFRAYEARYRALKGIA